MNYKKLRGFVHRVNYSIVQVIFGSIYFSISIIKLFDNLELGLIYLPIGILLIYQGLDRPMIGENGIYINGMFFNWDEIERFNWDLEKNNRLILTVKTRRPFLLWRSKIKYKISRDDRFQVDRLLKEYLIKG